MQCLYCKKEIKKGNASIEDIIPDSLTKGKRLRSSEIDCTTCNGELGREVDVAVTDWLPCKLARCVLRLAGKKGALPKVDFASPDGARITLDSELNPVVKKSSTRISEDESSASYKVIAESYEEGQREADKIIGTKTKRVEKTQELGSVRSEVKTTRRKYDPYLVNMGEAYDARLLSRAVAKIAFEYLATKLPRDVMLAGQFDEMRHFIRYGKISQSAMPCLASDTRLPMSTQDPFFHRVTCFCSSESGHAWGLVELFGHLRWFVLLSTSYHGPDIGCTILLHSPLDKGGSIERNLPICCKILQPTSTIGSVRLDWEAVVDHRQVDALVHALHVYVYRKKINCTLPSLALTLFQTSDGVCSITWARRLVSHFCQKEKLGNAGLCFISQNLSEHFARKTLAVLGEQDQLVHNEDLVRDLQRWLQEALVEACQQGQT